MGTTSMAQIHDVMISTSQRIWDAQDFPLRRDFLVKMGYDTPNINVCVLALRASRWQNVIGFFGLNQNL